MPNILCHEKKMFICLICVFKIMLGVDRKYSDVFKRMVSALISTFPLAIVAVEENVTGGPVR